MSKNNLKFPAFDLLETTTEIAYTAHNYKKLEPVKSGDKVSGLLEQQSPLTINALSGALGLSQGGVSAPYLHKILVLYFYSSRWGKASSAHLKQLNAIRNEVKYNDGNLIVIDSDGPESSLQQILWENNLSLTVHTDPSHQIAGLFGVYAEDSPIWNFYAGIDVNVPLPAIFVIDHFLKVVHADSNEEISSNLKIDEIVDAVYGSNHYRSGRKSA